MPRVVETEVPSYDEALLNIQEGKPTVLDHFVAEYEPAGQQNEREFRDDLVKVLNFAAQRGKVRWKP